MANKMIERLKAGPGPNTRIIRAMFAETFAFQYDDESGGLFGIDPGGFLMTRDELKDLIEGANIFFDHYGDEAVREHNEEKQRRHDAHLPSEEEPPKPYKSQKGWVYVVHGQEDQYKIGMTTRRPSARLAEWTPKLPFKTELVLTIPSDDVVNLEADIHFALREQRINGEWFKLTAADLDWLRGTKDGEL